MEDLRSLIKNARGYLYGEKEVREFKNILKENPDLIEKWNNIGTRSETEHYHSSEEIKKFYDTIEEKEIFVHVKYVTKLNDDDLPDIDFRLYDGRNVPVIQIVICL